MPQQRAIRAAQIFREHDNESVREMANIDADDMKGYVSMARLHIANLENALAADRELQAAADEADADEQRQAAAEVKV
jgi:ribosomal protein L12E/L44/L45/RPP1/RPP2